MKGSNPRRTPSTARPPLILRWIFLSMYFLSSGGCALVLIFLGYFVERFHEKMLEFLASADRRCRLFVLIFAVLLNGMLATKSRNLCGGQITK